MPEYQQKMTKQERQALSAQMKKCQCGNVLSLQRQEEGIEVCPRCEGPDHLELLLEIQEILNTHETMEYEGFYKIQEIIEKGLI